MIAFTVAQAFLDLPPGAYLVPITFRSPHLTLESLDEGATFDEIDDIVDSFSGLDDPRDVRLFSACNPYTLDVWLRYRKGLSPNILLDCGEGMLVRLEDSGVWDGSQSLSILHMNRLLAPGRVCKSYQRLFAH